MEKYILISLSEDGDKNLIVFKTEKELNKWLDEVSKDDDEFLDKCLTVAEVQASGLDYSLGYLLIKGDSIIPKIVKEVTKIRV